MKKEPLLRQLIRKALNESEVTAGPENTKFTLRTGVNKNPTKLGIKVQFTPNEGMLDGDTKAALEVALQEKLNTKLADYDIQVSKDTDVPREDVIGFFIPLSQIKNLIVTSITGKTPDKPQVAAPEPEGDNKPIPKLPPKNDNDDSPPDDKGLDESHLKLVIKDILLNEVDIKKVVDQSMDNDAIGKLQDVIRNYDLGKILNTIAVIVDRTGGMPEGAAQKIADLVPGIVPDESEEDTDSEKTQLNEVQMKVRELNEISNVVNKEDFYEFINKGNNIIRTLEENGINSGKKYLEYLVKNNIM